MKKIALLIISSVIFLVLLVGCSSTKNSSNIANENQSNTAANSQDIRETAYNQLPSRDKEKINGTWKDSRLTKITLNEGMGIISDKSYIGKEVYLVDFPIKTKAIPNNMVVYLSTDTNKFLGYGLVE
ncbi:hypothetical protein [Clostridium sp. 'White wine YQ']|uniref:hypothetical protein n=1 Tax=Clostridium sp. 'White wine YQ' TaxID=3027474 RepID=UPI00236506BA|nr:hypothetical protein [Clostridium sp. 'White wine YQ']MDD7796157.1 hypothetical protein [Clostridium sp. 'White wine YQ']